MSASGNSNQKKFSDLIIEKFILNELPASEMRLISEALKNSPELQTQIDRLRQSNQEILEKYPTQITVQKILRKKDTEESQKTNRMGRFWILAPAPVVALILLMTVYPFHRPDFSSSDGFEDRVKGFETTLSVYRKSSQGLEKLAHGASVKPHDLVQLSYTVEKKKYGVIFSVDGNRQVTLHWPEKSGSSPELEAGREVALPSSFELDESPLFEVFVLVTSDDPFDVSQILQIAQSGRMNSKTDRFEMDLKPEIRSYAITLRREP